MNVTDLTVLASFIARHRLAWDTFQSRVNSANVFITFIAFGFVQERGGWVLIDNERNQHVFREYRADIVALVSPLGNCVFTQGDVVAI